MTPARRSRRPTRIDLGPRPLTASLDEAMNRLMPPAGSGRAPARSPASVMAAWDEIAGPTVSRHVRPLRLSADVLVVTVDEPAWATQVRTLSATILARVGKVTGRAPRKLEVSVRAPTGGFGSRSE